MQPSTSEESGRPQFFTEEELRRIREFAETPKYARTPDMLTGEAEDGAEE
jgi:hypothetical protein